MAQKRISLFVGVAAATLALSLAVVWRTVYGRSAAESPPSSEPAGQGPSAGKTQSAEQAQPAEQAQSGQQPQADQQKYVGKWRFTSGEMKAGPGFPLSDKPAADGTTAKSLVGHLALVEVRDGTLWYSGEDRSCSHELRVGDGKAEVLPDGKVECNTPTPDGGAKQTSSVRMSMVVDAQDRAHVSGEARSSFELKGQRRDVTFTYQGVAVRDVPSAK